MNIIVAVDKNWGIGKDNDLLFKISEDMKNFRRITAGKVVVMGRKTLESLPGGRPLPNRINVVLTSSGNPSNVIVVRNITELIALTTEMEINNQNVFIIGGERIYADLLPYVTTAYVTHIDAEKQADKHFPDLSKMQNWEKTEESEKMTENEIQFTYAIWTNRIPKH